MATGSPADKRPLAWSAEDIAARWLREERRVLLFGPPGVGKSTLAGRLAGLLAAAGRRCRCISADPGSPAFGVPGTVSLAEWRGEGWQLSDYQPLCTLDAGRFRLPLSAAVRRLAGACGDGMLLIDGPGVVRGVAGRELLVALAEAAGVDLVLALGGDDRPPALFDELQGLPLQLVGVQAASEATRPGRRARARARTARWDRYLAGAAECTLDLAQLRLLGTPPPVGAGDAWVGRQLALLRGGHVVAMGQVSALHGTTLTVLAPAAPSDVDGLLLRDAGRGADGLLATVQPFAAERLDYLPPPDVLPPAVEQAGGPRVVGRVGPADLALVNGVFGDPLLHLRLRHQGRSLLFDLGDSARLAARVAHQVSDVFVSHAHMDHLGGFLWLLRSRLGDYPPCRLYGPPGLARHVQGLIEGFLWDRVGERGPAFEVAELHGEQLHGFRLQAGHPGCLALPPRPAPDGVVHREPGFQVRSVALDHHTAVLAYAFEPDREINVRKDRLAARGLAPGPWLSELKRQLLAGRDDALLALPDGSQARVDALAAELLMVGAGKRLVYATDFADTPRNRARVVALARHAHTLFCEAAFLEEDADHARRNGHLTTRACGEIANAAGVARLVPFHLSRRYLHRAQAVYDELQAVCDCVALPPGPGVFGASAGRAGETLVKLDESS